MKIVIMYKPDEWKNHKEIKGKLAGDPNLRDAGVTQVHSFMVTPEHQKGPDDTSPSEASGDCEADSTDTVDG